jgi:choline dehydrogenase-like flavoprotein
MKTDIPIADCAHQARTVVSGSDPAHTGAQHRLRARELDSLYVVDTRFFPQHQHGEPALTAMASALAVGGHLSNDSAERRALTLASVVSRQHCSCGGNGVARKTATTV